MLVVCWFLVVRWRVGDLIDKRKKTGYGRTEGKRGQRGRGLLLVGR